MHIVPSKQQQKYLVHLCTICGTWHLPCKLSFVLCVLTLIFCLSGTIPHIFKYNINSPLIIIKYLSPYYIFHFNVKCNIFHFNVKIAILSLHNIIKICSTAKLIFWFCCGAIVTITLKPLAGFSVVTFLRG